MKAYVKVKKDYNSGLIVGHSQNIQKAISGFNELACEVVPYYSLDDMYDQICREDIVVDYIKQCEISSVKMFLRSLVYSILMWMIIQNA